MKEKLIGLGLVGLTLALSIPLAQSQPTPPCKTGNTRNSAYLFRSNDRRCEGITTRPVSNEPFRLKSLTIGQFQDNEKLSFKIPKSKQLPQTPQPQVIIQSIPPRYYQLVPLDLKDTSNAWIFSWSNQVIHQEDINFKTLRSLAIQNDVALPIILSKPKSPQYDIRIYTGNRTSEITLKILKSNSSLIYQKILKNQPDSEVSFVWNGKTNQGIEAPPEIYTLLVSAQVQPRNAPTETRRFTQKFAHNITWLQ